MPRRSERAVDRRHPPNALMRVVNPIARRLVSMGKGGDQLVLLHYIGRKTGRAFDVPVGYHLVDGVPTVLTNSPWRRNFAGGQDIEVTFRGARHPARATFIADVDAVTDVYVDLIEGLGWKAAQRRLGVRINVKRMPTREEIAEAVRESGLSLVRLDGLVDDDNPRQRAV